MIHHELRQFQSDTSWTSEDETQQVRSVVLENHLSEKRFFLSFFHSCLRHETLQVFDQWMAERLADAYA